LRAKYDDFAYVNRLMKTAQLNYSICTSSDMFKLHSNLVENALWDGLKPDDMNVINSLLTEPLWEVTSATKSELTEETISNYTENVIALGFLKQGHVLINEFWQRHVGDFEVDSERFPTLEEAITIMHRRGFRIVFSIQPFISTESFNFAEAVKREIVGFGKVQRQENSSVDQVQVVPERWSFGYDQQTEPSLGSSTS
jgi:hypothetical protein